MRNIKSIAKNNQIFITMTWCISNPFIQLGDATTFQSLVVTNERHTAEIIFQREKRKKKSLHNEGAQCNIHANINTMFHKKANSQQIKLSHLFSWRNYADKLLNYHRYNFTWTWIMQTRIMQLSVSICKNHKNYTACR